MANGFNKFGNFNPRSGSPNFGMSGNLYQDYLKNTNPLLYNQKFGGALTGFTSNIGSGGAGQALGGAGKALGLLGKIGGAVGTAMPVIGAVAAGVGAIVNIAKAIKQKRMAQEKDTIARNQLNKAIAEIGRTESEEIRINNMAFEEGQRQAQVSQAQQIDAAQAAGPRAAQATAQAIQSGTVGQQFALAAEKAKQIEARQANIIQEKQQQAQQMAGLYSAEADYARAQAEDLRGASAANVESGIKGVFGMAPALAQGVPLYGTEAYNQFYFPSNQTGA
tara:strand:+ start:18320 stop:19153 length:834 start_codon:yes stop_codon:yes gene_type:complete